MEEFATAEKKPKLSVLLGLPIHNLNMEAIVGEAKQAIELTRPKYFVHVNTSLAALIQKDEDLKSVLFNAERVICGSLPLLWLSRLLKAPLVERIRYSVFLRRVMLLCAENNFSVGIFGSSQQLLRKAKIRLEKSYPGLKVESIVSAPFGGIYDWDNSAILKEIKKSEPDLLLVALDTPMQENWVYAHYKKLGIPLILGVGKKMQFIFGKRPRSLTSYMRSLGDCLFLLEYAYKQMRSMRKVLHTKPQGAGVRSIASTDVFYNIEWSGMVDCTSLQNLPEPEDYGRHVVCECSGVTFIDSSGLGKLAQMSRNAARYGKFFAIFQPSSVVSEAIEVLQWNNQIRVIHSEEELREAFCQYNEDLVLFKPGEHSGEYLVKPLVSLNARSIERVEKGIYELLPKMEKGSRVVLSLEYVDSIDSMAIAAFLAVKKNLARHGVGFLLTMVHGLPYQTLHVLELSRILIEPAHLEVMEGIDLLEAKRADIV